MLTKCIPYSQRSDVRHLSCDALKDADHGWGFTMNERWLDWQGQSPFCEDFIYSILIRDPAKRLSSARKHALLGKEKSKKVCLNRKQSNYLTWALLADSKGKFFFPWRTKNGRQLSSPYIGVQGGGLFFK